ncbi:putative Membrane-spanning 4-domains subfamily A member 12-like protein, partial [Naja naja]
SVGYGLSSVLLMFSMLEFCIAVSLTHFGCQAACCSDAQPTMVFVPYQVGGREVAAEPNLPPPPPSYDNSTPPSTCHVTLVLLEASLYFVLSGCHNLAVATLPASMASGTVFVIPSNGANIIQMAPGLPSVALQASGATPYPQYGAQQLGISTSAPQQVIQKGPLERFLKAEPKVLGTIQILIGLIHIGFGAISFCLFPFYYLTLSGVGGYPFWGGIFFISSGSVCISAVNCPNRALVKSSVGLNITSAVMALSGVILYLCKLIFSNNFGRYYMQYYTDDLIDAEERLRSVGYGLSSVLLLFSLLEFCITVSLAHFGCQATCCSDAQPAVLFVPYQVVGSGEVPDEPNPPPPTYEN